MSQILIQYSDIDLHGLKFTVKFSPGHADRYVVYTSVSQVF